MESAFRSIWTRFLLPVVILIVLAGTVWAQGTGQIEGLVTDPTGAVVSGVKVVLNNSATGEKRTTVTNSEGAYRFPELPIVGTYTILISSKGFKSLKVEGLVISVGTTATKDLKLELGAASEEVTVEAGAETVQTSDSSVSQLIDRRIWQQMPLDVRNQNSFIELVAGASPQDGSGTNRGAEVNGTRSGAGSYLVEGVDNNEQGQAGRGQISTYDKGGASTSISPDAIQEYRVITNTFSAEYGKGGGFITDTVLKSGTNQWHGSLFEYNRIQALTANDWWSNKSGIKDSLVRNQFGGSIGGPIIKDKTFLYGTVEIHRVRQSAPTGAFTAVTQQFLDFVKDGQFQQWAEGTGSFGPGTTTPGICLVYLGAPCPGAYSSVATTGPIFSQLTSGGMPFPAVNSTTDCSVTPTPNGCISRGLYSGGLAYPVPVYDTDNISSATPFNESRFSIKFDHRLSSNDQLSAVYLFQNGTTDYPFGGGYKVIGPPTQQTGRGQNFGLTWNHTFSPTLLNTFKAGYLRHRLDFPPGKGTAGVPSYYTIDGLGEDLGQYAGLPQFFTENQFQYLDTMSLQKGKHALKFGGEYRRTRNGSSFFNDAYSTILPWSVEDDITDLNFTTATENLLFGGPYYGSAYEATAAVVPSTGKEPVFYRGYRANEYAFFVQDDWRVNSRLTVNLGLRWEYFGPPHNFQKGIDSNFYFGSNVTPVPTATNNPGFPASSPFYASVATGNFAVRDSEIWNKDTNNFGPRIGFAWDALGNQKMVVRAGFGVMYDRIYNNLFENIRFNPPYYSDNEIGIFATGVPVDPSLFAVPFTDTQRALFNDPIFAPKPNPRHMDQNIVTPYYEQAHLGVQWEIARGYVFEPEYITTLGHKLTGISDINTFDGRLACPNGSSAVCQAAGFPSGFSTQRINTNIGADNYRNNAFDSNYHSLQLSLRKNYSSGLGFTANYTYSKAMDQLSDAFNNRNGSNPTDGQNLHYDYGPADFDLRHRFVSTISYELPFMKSNRWIGGWGTNAIISYQTGHPVTPYDGSSGYDLNKDGHFLDRIVPTEAPMSTLLSGSPGNGYIDPTKWGLYDPLGTGTGSCPLTVNQGLWCNAPIGRNTVFGPHAAIVDFNMTKKFKITERAALTFQANFFNLFNHPNFLPPDPNYQDLGSTFGVSTSTWGDNGGHRITQLAARFDF